MNRSVSTSIILFFLVLPGCSTTRDVAWPEPRPLGATTPAYHPPTSTDTGLADPVAQSIVPELLTFRHALSLTLLQNPDLRVTAWEVRAREARALQAGLSPNPEIGLEVEDFGGTGQLNGFDAMEMTAGLSQRVELGGDRRRRRGVANLERDLAGWDYETVRLDVLTQTVQSFVSVLALQVRRSMADSLLTQAQRFYESVVARVEAGKVSGLEERRALVVLSTSRIAQERTERELRGARARLAALWGSQTPAFDRVVGDLATVRPPPRLQRLEDFVERNPDVARWRDEMTLRRAEVALERARQMPDPVVTVGVRRLGEIGETGLMAGVSVPLSVFDRNQGAIREAEYRIRRGEEERRAASVEARRVLVEVYQEFAGTYVEVTALREEALPAARENFLATEEGYREGKFDLLTVLDAQRTFFETTNRYIDSLAAFHTARAEVERLIGTPLSDI